MIRRDGSIEIESPPIIITPKFSREDFMVSPLFPVTTEGNQNKPYSRYEFKLISAEHGEPFQGSVCFAWGHLYDFVIYSLRKELENEDARHEFHKQLLETTLKRAPDEKRYLTGGGDEIAVVYRFSWGTVSAGIDTKTWDAIIYTRYFTHEFPE